MYSDTVIEALTVVGSQPRPTIASISAACTLRSHAAAGCRGNYGDPLATEQTVESLTLFGRGSGPLYYTQGQQAE